MSTPRYATLRDYLRVLRAQRRIIILSVFLFGGVALLVSLTQEKSYKAEATLQLHDLSEDLTLLGTPAAADSLITIQTQVTAKEISSPEVVAAVAKKLPQIFKKSDRSAIKAQVEATTNLVVITATNEDPANAARLANAFADQYRIFKQRETRNRLGESVRTLTARLNRLRRRTPNSTRKPFEFSDDDLGSPEPCQRPDSHRVAAADRAAGRSHEIRDPAEVARVAASRPQRHPRHSDRPRPGPAHRVRPRCVEPPRARPGRHPAAAQASVADQDPERRHGWRATCQSTAPGN